MGEVFLAIDPKSGSQIALKRPWFKLEADPKAIKRFEREAKAASSIQHPNICKVYDFGRVADRHFITMEYIDGLNLAHWVQDHPHIPPSRALRLIKLIALGLDAIHAAGVIHRDLKPANIVMTADENPIITDFGMANLIDNATAGSRLTPAGAMIGTPAYMSPEQILADQERFCPASDLYSLGIIMYELLCGWPPFSGSLATILGTIVSEPPPDLQVHSADLDPSLNEICQKALGKEPADRFQTGEQFAAAIDQWQAAHSESHADGSSGESSENPHAAEGTDRSGRITRMIRSLFK